VQQAEVSLKKLVDPLEEPAMCVDFTLVTLLNAKEEVNPVLLQVDIFQTEVPGRDLEHVEQVLRQVLRWDVVVHNVVHVLHLVFAISIFFHEASPHKNLLVKEILFSRKLLKTFGDVIVAIADEEDAEVVLRKLGLRVHAHCVVVVNNATESALQFRLVFVVHGNARSDLRILLT